MQIIGTVLAIALLLCLAPMPYGYYMVVRTAASIVFVYFALTHKSFGNSDMMVVCLILAALFQPIIKIPLGRALWNILDIAVAIGLFAGLTPKDVKSSENHS